MVVRKDTKTVPYWDTPTEYRMATSKDEDLDATKDLNLAVTREPKTDQPSGLRLVVRKDAKTVPYWDNPMEYPMASSKDGNLDAMKALHLAMAREVAMDQTWASKSEVRKDMKTVSYWDVSMEFPMAASKDEDLDATMALHLATEREIAKDQAWASNLVLRKDTKMVS